MSETALRLDGVACTFANRGDASQRYTAVHGVTLDLGAVFTNDFVKKANAKVPKG